MRNLWLVLLLLIGPAGADELPAKEHFQRARAAYSLGHFADAAREFESAYQIRPEGALLFNAAQAHRQAGNRQRALFLYRNYARDYGFGEVSAEELGHIINELERTLEEDPRLVDLPPGPPRLDAPKLAAISFVVPPKAAAPKKKKRTWIWGVAGGAAAAGLAIVLGSVLGAPSQTPSPTLGAVRGN